MKGKGAESRPTHQINPAVLVWFDVTNNTCLFVAGLIATIILAGWIIPPFGQLLPDGWTKMQATSALCVLCITLALSLGKQSDHGLRTSISRLLAVLCILVVGITLFELGFGREAVLGPYLAAKTQLPLVHPTSIQSASCFFVLAISYFIAPSRQDRTGYILDVLVMILVILNLLFVAGYIYEAASLIKVTSSILISPQTLVCIALLTFVQITRRAPFGVYAILVSRGIAGNTARIVLPFSVMISYVIILSQTQLTSAGLLEAPYVAAATAVASSAIMIVVVILLSNKIEKLEYRLHAMSIVDELTGAYNLRGLNLHGKQKLLDAKRSASPLSVLYIDVDGLKQVNDSLGHDTGSALIRDVVSLLHDNSRESDIVSRIGGDEFVVVAYGSDDAIDSAIRRLNDVADEINRNGNKPYKIGFSIGKATFDPHSNESLEDLISRADAAMYKVKMSRRAVRASDEIDRPDAPGNT